MIRVHRQNEPANLAANRIENVARVRAELAAGTNLSNDLIGVGYQVARGPLASSQAAKCAYCEKVLYEPPYNDVEHYRPKVRAERGDGYSTQGYWWLAWTWENLLFACPPCDRSYKRALFPLQAQSVELADPEIPPGLESPFLINPAEEEPMDHIRFIPFDFDGMIRWRPTAKNGSMRGVQTIHILKLDRDDLVTSYRDHMEMYVDPVIQQLCSRAGQKEEFQTHWLEAAVPLTSWRRPFSALAWDALDYYFPSDRRIDLSVTLDRPTPL